jgi:hypothetical protein
LIRGDEADLAGLRLDRVFLAGSRPGRSDGGAVLGIILTRIPAFSVPSNTRTVHDAQIRIVPGIDQALAARVGTPFGAGSRDDGLQHLDADAGLEKYRRLEASMPMTSSICRWRTRSGSRRRAVDLVETGIDLMIVDRLDTHCQGLGLTPGRIDHQ